jgi:cytochrome c oxidase assembly protein subunit 11
VAKTSHKRLLAVLVLIVIGMFGFGFALVPIYNSLCKTLGINGKTTGQAVAYDPTKSTIDKSRMITVEFVATKKASIPWEFYPQVKKIRVHPGDIARLSFYAENKSNGRMTVQAIPSITPGLAAKYLKKTECFCFEQQTLNSHEAMNMPLLFHLDPELPSNIQTVTLSYTLFDVTGRYQP